MTHQEQELTTFQTAINAPNAVSAAIYSKTPEEEDDEKSIIDIERDEFQVPCADTDSNHNDGSAKFKNEHNHNHNHNQNKKEKGRCTDCQICCSSALLYYLEPITMGICHSMSCVLYHVTNFVVTFILFWYQVFTIPVWVLLLLAACTGVLVLWCSLEITLIMSRIDLGFAKYMVNDDQCALYIAPEKRHLLQLSVYTDNIPLCCCYSSTSIRRILHRCKYLLTTCNTWSILFYHLIGKPVCTFIMSWTTAVIIGMIIYVLFDWRKATVGMATEKIVFVLLFPLLIRLNNWTACGNKAGAYYFYTYFYSKNVPRSLHEERGNLLKTNKENTTKNGFTKIGDGDSGQTTKATAAVGNLL